MTVFALTVPDCPFKEGVDLETATIMDCEKIIYTEDGDKDDCPCTKKSPRFDESGGPDRNFF